MPVVSALPSVAAGRGLVSIRQESVLIYSFDSWHVLLAALGVSLIAAYWLPQVLFRTPPGSSALIMLAGMICYHWLPNMPAPLDPLQSPQLWETSSELVVIVVLFATGLRIDEISGWRRWRATVRLLAIAMPLTIFAVALLGWSLAGMTVAGAVTLGAVLAPTDPVLAGDVQVGPPQAGREHPVRFTLTAEAGLNDGLAFPFVYLGLAIAAHGADPDGWLGRWLVIDVAYRIAVGVIGGLAVGWLLGRASFVKRGWGMLGDNGPGVIALAGALVSYAMVELAEGYGFLAVFFAGVAFRRSNHAHGFHGRLHDFSEAIEQAVTAFLLFALGATLPLLWPYLDWRHALIGFGLIFVIRPVAALISLAGLHAPPAQKIAVSFLGVRGVGSLYYIAYASGHIEFINEGELWALVAFTIFASAVIHGLTARLIVRHVTEEEI